MNKTKLLQYSITFAVCGILVFLYSLIGNIFTIESTSEILKLLVNAFFSIGIITLCIGLLVVASNGGAYDMLFYGITRFLSLFKKNHNDVKYKTFYDYHLAKLDREKSSFAFLLIVGGIYIAISLIILIFWYQI